MPNRGSRRGAGGILACGALILVALAASCRRSAGDEPVVPPDQLANAIESVRQLKDTPPPPPHRLSFLTPQDLGRVTGYTSCILREGDRPLLVAGPAHALARVDGKPVLLDLAGPMDASAAFFKGPRVTISIGRHMTVAPAADKPGVPWSVGVTVGAVPQGDVQKLAATWACDHPRAVREPVVGPG